MRATIDHIGIAVGNLSESLAFFRDALGLDVGDPQEVGSQCVRAHVVFTGDGPDGATLELLEATAEDSPIAKYVAKRGPGMHHIALRVDNLVAALAELEARGVRLIDETPRPGTHGTQVAFIHPSSTHGVLVELVEKR